MSETRQLPTQEALRGQVGMWLFVASDLVGFVALVSTLLAAGSIQPSGLQLFLVTALSAMVAGLLFLIRRDRANGFYLLAAALLAIAAVSLAGLDLAAMVGAGASSSLSRAEEARLALAGFHGLHLFAGVVAVLRACLARKSGCALALYWSFVAMLGVAILAVEKLS